MGVGGVPSGSEAAFTLSQTHATHQHCSRNIAWTHYSEGALPAAWNRPQLQAVFRKRNAERASPWPVPNAGRRILPVVAPQRGARRHRRAACPPCPGKKNEFESLRERAVVHRPLIEAGNRKAKHLRSTSPSGPRQVLIREDLHQQ